MSAPTRFLILPSQGIQPSPGTGAAVGADPQATLASPAKVAALRERLHVAITGSASRKGQGHSKLKAQGASEADFHVVASIPENGVRLVSATPEMAAAYRFEEPGVRVVPEVFYKPAQFYPRPRKKVARAHTAAAGTLRHSLEVEVVRADTQQPVRDVEVTGFTDYENRAGVEGSTKGNGKVTLIVPSTAQVYERLYVRHELPGLWSHVFLNQNTQGQLQV